MGWVGVACVGEGDGFNLDVCVRACVLDGLGKHWIGLRPSPESTAIHAARSRNLFPCAAFSEMLDCVRFFILLHLLPLRRFLCVVWPWSVSGLNLVDELADHDCCVADLVFAASDSKTMKGRPFVRIVSCPLL